MNNKLSSELQRIPVHGLILFFEGHVFKLLGNLLVPSGIKHKCVLSGVRVVRSLQEKSIGNFLVGEIWIGLLSLCHYRLNYDYTVFYQK